VTFKREINIKTLQYKYMQPVGYNLTRSKANCVFTVWIQQAVGTPVERNKCNNRKATGVHFSWQDLWQFMRPRHRQERSEWRHATCCNLMRWNLFTWFIGYSTAIYQ